LPSLVEKARDGIDRESLGGRRHLNPRMNFDRGRPLDRVYSRRRGGAMPMKEIEVAPESDGVEARGLVPAAAVETGSKTVESVDRLALPAALPLSR
jgi:hypothetical protein